LNRLVAGELERRWEAALTEQRAAEESLDRFRQQQPIQLGASHESMIRSLASDIPALWQASTTSGLDRQSIVRALIEEAVVERTERVRVTIRWAGGFESHREIIKSVGKFEQLESAAEIRRQVIELKRRGQSHQQVADALNASGYRTALAGAFTGPVISALCKKLRAEGEDLSPPRAEHTWTLSDLASRLGIKKETLSTWRRRGWVHATKVDATWTFIANADELKRLKKLTEEASKKLHPS
jgi:hypothetical protein